MNTEEKPSQTRPVKSKNPWDTFSRPMLTRKDALSWINTTFWVYIVTGLLDAFIGLIPVTIILIILALFLKFSHSRAAAITLLVLSGLALVVTFSIFQYHITMLSFIQCAVTARAVEATYKLRRKEYQSLNENA